MGEIRRFFGEFVLRLTWTPGALTCYKWHGQPASHGIRRMHVRRLAGKHAIVTGAASGIGRAITLELARQKCHLFLIDIDSAGLDEVAEDAIACGVQVSRCAVDLADPRQISDALRRVVGQWKQIDILVNNAGICFCGGSTNMKPEQWDRLMSVNLLAPVQITRELLPYLLSRPRSHIINVASMYGLFATSRCTAYHTTKFGLVGFSEALRAEYKRFGLGVTTLCPGFVKTKLLTSMHNQDARAQQGLPAWLSTTPHTVARRAVQAIRWNRSLVVISPFAKFGYFCKRLSPGLLAAFVSMGRRKRYNTAQRQAELNRMLPETLPVKTAAWPTAPVSVHR